MVCCVVGGVVSPMGFSSIAHIKRFAFFPRFLYLVPDSSALFFASRLCVCVAISIFISPFNSVETICLVPFFTVPPGHKNYCIPFGCNALHNLKYRNETNRDVRPISHLSFLFVVHCKLVSGLRNKFLWFIFSPFASK